MSCAKSPMMRVADFASRVKSGNTDALFVCFVYAVFVCLALVMWHVFSDQDESAIVTLGGLSQTVGFYLLLHKMQVTRSAAGVSSKTLQTYVLALCFRLSSTCFANGYLPVDRSGDWFYQATDIASLLIVFQALFMCHKRYADTYQEDLDTFPIYKILPACFMLGFCLCGHMNGRTLLDKTWMTGLWCDSVAMLPQLWMLVAKGGKVEALTANFVALVFFANICSYHFWFTGYEDLAPKDPVSRQFTGEFNKLGATILTAQSLQLLISADFMYHYFKWQSTNCKVSGLCGASHETDEKAAGSMVLPARELFDV